jgi:hypothetical protein
MAPWLRGCCLGARPACDDGHMFINSFISIYDIAASKCMPPMVSANTTVLPSHRVEAKLHPTDWLEALPKSALIELMKMRCQAIGGAAMTYMRMEPPGPWRQAILSK